MKAILTVNSGSSSLKLGLFAEDLSTLAMCHVDRIGRREAAMKIHAAAGPRIPASRMQANTTRIERLKNAILIMNDACRLILCTNSPQTNSPT